MFILPYSRRFVNHEVEKKIRSLKKSCPNGKNHGKMHENAHGDLGRGCKTTILKKISQTPCIFESFGIKYILERDGNSLTARIV
jgi:deoxyxylulose-5-phosphate synthase